MTLNVGRKSLLVLAVLGLGALLWATMPALRSSANTDTALAADLPPGALLTIESSDFADLLHTWTRSPEEQAWLKSANYSAFTNSRLLPRLAEAQNLLAGSAGTALGSSFLEQIAGKQSIFAWYDIGNLEFLYITHLPPGAAARIDLLKQAPRFSHRTAGDTTFYVRTSSACEQTASGQSCTVAFATRGDLLLLATREDLVANALSLMQSAGPSMAQEGWFAAASSAGPAQQGELHMLLDLQRLTRTPQFRTYWLQRNVTETRRFRAAVVDLYREPNRFREERTLLPMAANPSAAEDSDLAQIESLVPAHAGFYRIVAQPSAAAVLASLEEKVLTRTTASTIASTGSPDADLPVPDAGAPADFEERIDTPIVAAAAGSSDVALQPLRHLLESAKITAMLTLDRTDPPEEGALFVPIHSAVILRREGAWNAQELASALLDALGSGLSAGRMGLAWKPSTSSAHSYSTMSATQPFALSITGDTAILATESALIDDLLTPHVVGTPRSHFATLIANFRPGQERASFLRLTSALDAPDPHQGAPLSNDAGAAPAAPAFFRDNLGSLTNTFASLASERFEEQHQDALTRQTVTYNWPDR